MNDFWMAQRIELFDSRGASEGFGLIEKVNPKNYRVKLDNDRRFNVPRTAADRYLRAAVGEGVPPAPMKPFVPAPSPGQFVTVAVATVTRQPKLEGVWIAIGSSGGGKTRIVKPGGDNGRYWRIPNEDLTVVNCIVTVVFDLLQDAAG